MGKRTDGSGGVLERIILTNIFHRHFFIKGDGRRDWSLRVCLEAIIRLRVEDIIGRGVLMLVRPLGPGKRRRSWRPFRGISAPSANQLVVIKTVCRMEVRRLDRDIIRTIHTILSNIPPNAGCEGGRNVDNDEHCGTSTAEARSMKDVGERGVFGVTKRV